jgi:uncharacterized protein with PIN domain
MFEQVNIGFYQELNDFLPAVQRNTVFTHELKQPGSVKDLIESIGIPHTEIDLIIVNGESVDFGYLVHSGDSISVYPVSKPCADKVAAGNLALNSSLRYNQPGPLCEPRFVLDVHLGRLASYLRLLGFDTLYRNDYDDATLASVSVDEYRILLTCDRRLLMRKIITHGYFVRARQLQQQLFEVLSRFDLYDKKQPFTRCMHCNGRISPVNKKDIETQLLAKTKKYYDEFFQCESCRKIYWKGSHYQKMQDMINQVKAGFTNSPSPSN